MSLVGEGIQVVLSGAQRLMTSMSDEGSATSPAIDGSFIELMKQQAMDLIGMQVQAQFANQEVTTISNINKSDHETKMAAIRNLSVR